MTSFLASLFTLALAAALMAPVAVATLAQAATPVA
jgi:hypothetical protein